MTDSEALAIATRLYVRLRQHAGRVIDAVWMSQNIDYAREILKLCRMQADPELNQLADRFEAIMFGPGTPARPFNPAATGVFQAAASSGPSEATVAKYMRTLR